MHQSWRCERDAARRTEQVEESATSTLLIVRKARRSAFAKG